MYKFFKVDLDALVLKIKEIAGTIREAGQQMGAATEDGEREHDNPELDDAQQRFKMWSKQLHELNSVRRQAEIVDPAGITSDHVSVGCDVTFIDQDDNTRTVSIGSYLPANGSTISYNAPIAKILMGLKVGEYHGGTIAGKDVEFEVISIKATTRQ